MTLGPIAMSALPASVAEAMPNFARRLRRRMRIGTALLLFGAGSFSYYFSMPVKVVKYGSDIQCAALRRKRGNPSENSSFFVAETPDAPEIRVRFCRWTHRFVAYEPVQTVYVTVSTNEIFVRQHTVDAIQTRFEKSLQKARMPASVISHKGADALYQPKTIRLEIVGRPEALSHSLEKYLARPAAWMLPEMVRTQLLNILHERRQEWEQQANSGSAEGVPSSFVGDADELLAEVMRRTKSVVAPMVLVERGRIKVEDGDTAFAGSQVRDIRRDWLDGVQAEKKREASLVAAASGRRVAGVSSTVSSEATRQLAASPTSTPKQWWRLW